MLGRSPSRRGSGKRSHSPWKGFRPPHQGRSRSISPEYRTTCLDRRSRSPSPLHETLPPGEEYYGTTQLERRSRSPSPSSAHSLPIQRLRTSGRRTGGGRRLPATPSKPSSLRLTAQSVEGINFPVVSHSPTVPQPNRSPNNINFPRVNASPSHLPKSQQLPSREWRSGSAAERSCTVMTPDHPSHALTLPSHLVHSLRTTGRIGSTSSLKGPRELPQPPLAPTIMPYYGAEALPLQPIHPMEPPLCLEADLALGRSGGPRLLPSPMPNGYKPGQSKERNRDPPQPPQLSLRTSRPLLMGPRSTPSTLTTQGVLEAEDDDDDWC